MSETSFHIRNTFVAKRVAKDLRAALLERKLAFQHHRCLNLVAEMFGFANWTALERGAASLNPSAYDQDANPEVVSARFERHVRVLVDVDVPRAVALDVVRQIKPTSSPTGEAAPKRKDPFTDEEFFNVAEGFARKMVSGLGTSSHFRPIALGVVADTRKLVQVNIADSDDASDEGSARYIRELLAKQNIDRYTVIYQAELVGSAAAAARTAAGNQMIGVNAALEPAVLSPEAGPGSVPLSGLPETALFVITWSRTGKGNDRLY
jgi:Glyoxalase superfamily protein